MEELIVRDFGNEEAYRYEQLVCVSFHEPCPELLDKEQFVNKLCEIDRAMSEDRSELRGNTFVRKGLFKGDRLIAAIKIHSFVVHFDGKKCELGGIGGVLSDPQMRNMGSVSRILQQAFVDMKHKGQVISHLYPFKTSFYRKYGYEHCLTKVCWTIPTDYLPRIPFSGIVHYENATEQKRDIKSVYAEFSKKYNLATARTERKWDAFLEAHSSYNTPYYSYLHYNNNRPDGFFTYTVQHHETEPMTINVQSIYFAKVSALREMLAFLGSYSSYAKQVRVTLPFDVDITHMLAEVCGVYGKKNVKREVLARGASRVIDVEAILKLARYNGRGSVDIQIHDAHCSWNDKCFHIEFNGECIGVGEGGKCDAEMDIADFTVLILGGHSMEEYDLLESVKVYGNMENLKKVFYKKTTWMEESF